MKSKSAKAKTKLTFEDGVRAALIAGIVIFAAVLGIGGFFALRSVLGASSAESAEGDIPGLDSEAYLPERGAVIAGEEAPPEALPDSPAPGDAPMPGDAPAPGTDSLPGGTPPAPEIFLPPEPAKPGRPVTDLPPERRGILVFVIDDAGNNLRELEPFLKFPGPLTIAVLPGLPDSAEAAARIRKAGKELFLHQPMEPLGGQDPGPGAISSGMDKAQIKTILDKNLAELWPVAGLNNHEGSKATMDPVIMRAVLENCRDRRIHFLDSRTIADIASPAIALEMGFPIAQRDVFLDNEQDRDSIVRAIEEGCRKAERNGVAVMIGHVWSPALAGILTEMYPTLKKKGYFLTTVSGILDIGK